MRNASGASPEKVAPDVLCATNAIKRWGLRLLNRRKMIRKAIHIGLAMLLSSFFLIAGTGYLSVHYCCDVCREAGIEHVMEESCEAIHHHTEHHHTGCCHHENECSVQYLQVSQFMQSTQLHAPHAQEMQLMNPALPTMECCEHLHAHCVPAFMMIVPPPPLVVNGQAVLRDVCCWIC